MLGGRVFRSESAGHMLGDGYDESYHLFAVRATDLCKECDPTCSGCLYPFAPTRVEGSPRHATGPRIDSTCVSACACCLDFFASARRPGQWSPPCRAAISNTPPPNRKPMKPRGLEKSG